jgi:hypothetical protein
MGCRLTIRGRCEEPPGGLLDQVRVLAHHRSLNFSGCESQPTPANFDFWPFLGVDRNRCGKRW